MVNPRFRLGHGFNSYRFPSEVAGDREGPSERLGGAVPEGQRAPVLNPGDQKGNVEVIETDRVEGISLDQKCGKVQQEPGVDLFRKVGITSNKRKVIDMIDKILGFNSSRNMGILVDENVGSGNAWNVTHI